MATDERPKENLETNNPVILSKGASLALGNVFKRLVGSEKRDKATEKKRKRPKTAILGQNEEVEKALAAQAEERKRLKRAKKAKIAFENNALVIPDAATGATLEKELLAIATKGAVALFNAVSKAQKSIEEKEDVARNKKKGPPVSRESFMEMMKAGLTSNGPSTAKDNEASNSEKDDTDESSDEANVARSKARWLKDDFLTKGSKSLESWGRKQEDDSDEDSEPDSENDEQAGDDAAVSGDDSSDGSTSS